MATTNIELDIENITGIGTGNANAQFVISAQKSVVASIPKNLLKWAATLTSPSSHGGNTSQGINVVMPTATDSILDVSRNGFSADEVPYNMKGFIANTASLHLATNTYPKYYLDNAVTDKGTIVIVKPIPTDSETVRVLYVDFTKIDDDCDLRNAVVYRASSSEFEKLASSKVIDWTDLVPPVAPTSPDFGSDLTMSSSAPAVPVLSDVTVSFGTAVPTYVNPIISLEAPPTISNLSITAVAPSTPSLTSVVFTSIDSSLDTVAPTFTTATVSASSVYTGSAPTYTAPVLSLTTFPTITWSFPSVPIAPSPPTFTTPGIGTVTVASTLLSTVGSPPTYTPPQVGGETEELTGGMHAPSSGTGFGTDDDFLDFSRWFGIVGEFIEDEEDTELASAQLQKISAYLQAYTSAIQNKLNIFNDENVEFQAKLKEAAQQAQINAQTAQSQSQIDSTEQQQEASLLLQKENQEYAASIQSFSFRLQGYQADVNKITTGNQAEIAEWQQRNSINLQKYGTDVQSAVNTFNKENIAYQSAIQESMQDVQVANQVNLAKSQADLQTATTNNDRNQQRQLQNGINDMQAIVNDNTRKVNLYQAESSQYQAIVNTQVQEYQQNLAGDTQVWQIGRTTDLQKYGSDIQDALNSFNKENVEYQSQLQISLKDADLSAQGDAQKLQKYTAELTTYQHDMNKEIQDFVNTLQKETQEYQSKVTLYGSDLQKYQAEVGEKTAKLGTSAKNADYYSREADKYYKWAIEEVKTYIQTNSKMINQTMTAEAAQQQ